MDWKLTINRQVFMFPMQSSSSAASLGYAFGPSNAKSWHGIEATTLHSGILDSFMTLFGTIGEFLDSGLTAFDILNKDNKTYNNKARKQYVACARLLNTLQAKLNYFNEFLKNNSLEQYLPYV